MNKPTTKDKPDAMAAQVERLCDTIEAAAEKIRAALVATRTN